MKILLKSWFRQQLSQTDRLIKLNQIVIQQMSVLQDIENRKSLK